MYGMTNSVKLFSNELTIWLIDESGFNIRSVKYPYITSMHQMVTSYLCYLMLMTVYIGILLKN